MLLIALLALAGCGSSSSNTSSSASTPPASSTPSGAAQTPTTSSAASAPASTSGSGQSLALAASSEGQLKYTTSSLTAKAGKVSIDFTNMSPVEHNMTVASTSGGVVGATPTFQGGSKTLTLNLKPGTYKFFCTVPGHRAAGMEGTLTVQ